MQRTVCLRCLYGTLLPRILKGELPKCLEAILNSLLEPSEVVTKQSFATVRVLIEEYGGAYPGGSVLRT